MDFKKIPNQPSRFWPTLHWHRYWFVVAALTFLGLVALNFDIAIAKTVNAESVRGDANRILKLSEFFAHGFGIAVVLTGIWTLVPAKRKLIPRLFVAAVFPAAIVHLFKITVARKRPIQFLREFPDSIAETWHGWMPSPNGLGFNVDYALQAFPSAHTATVISFAIALGWAFPKGRVFFLALAALAASQRIVFEAHWTSDVLVGAAIGVMVGSAMTKDWGFGYWCGLFETRNQNEEPELKIARENVESKRAA